MDIGNEYQEMIKNEVLAVCQNVRQIITLNDDILFITTLFFELMTRISFHKFN